MSETIHVKVKDVPKTLRMDLKMRTKGVYKGLYLGALRGKALLMKRTPVDEGNMKGAWRVIRRAFKTVVINNDAPYAGVIEGGARPHGVSQAGREALLGWVLRHFPNATAKEAQSIVWGIVHKLKTEGQKPTWFVRKSIPELQDLMEREIRRQLARAVVR